MQIHITGRHMEITDAIRDYVHTKMQHDLMEFPRVESVHVILDLEKYRQIAEVVIQAPNHIRVEAKAVSDNLYSSIDSASEKAAKQVRRSWEKITDHKSREKLAQVDLHAQSAAESVEP
ncbi:MAG: ribosome-associated translation inhibitor RaiA [Lentisphaerota bacterium]